MNNKAVGAIALLSAGLASICCIGPLVLTALGLGSLGMAANLTQYRPLFLALTAITLAAAFYFAYRKRATVCADGRCEFRSSSRTMKAALWIVTAMAMSVASFPNWSAWVLSRGPAVIPAGAQILAFRVSGMDCVACTVAIKKSVERVPGVLSASVDFNSQKAKVVTNSRVDPQTVVTAIAAAGYKAALLQGKGNGKS